jgi:chromatin remodeling complex protein RSC6
MAAQLGEDEIPEAICRPRQQRSRGRLRERRAAATRRMPCRSNLQNPENRREILADDKLKKVFGKDKVTVFEMNKYLAQHLK